MLLPMRDGKKVGFTAGAFDLCHAGHMLMFEEGWEAPQGELEFQDHGLGLNFHAYEMTALSVKGNRGGFAGKGRLNGVDGYTFVACAVDNGEPGANRVLLALVLSHLSYSVRPHQVERPRCGLSVDGCLAH